jgi:hypothetical protein
MKKAESLPCAEVLARGNAHDEEDAGDGYDEEYYSAEEEDACEATVRADAPSATAAVDATAASGKVQRADKFLPPAAKWMAKKSKPQSEIARPKAEPEVYSEEDVNAEMAMPVMPAAVAAASPAAEAAGVSTAAEDTAEESAHRELHKFKKEYADFQEMKRTKERVEAAQSNGQILLFALQCGNDAGVDELLALHPSSETLDYSAQDESGMTCLHYAARLVNPVWYEQCRDRHPSNMDVRTYWSRTPARWSVLNCISDTPRSRDESTRMAMVTMVLDMLEHMKPEVIGNKTRFGTNCIHQLAARGHGEVLKALLQKIDEQHGRTLLLDLIQEPCGKKDDAKGSAVDTALKSRQWPLAKLLQKYGGTQLLPPVEEKNKFRIRATETDDT